MLRQNLGENGRLVVVMVLLIKIPRSLTEAGTEQSHRVLVRSLFSAIQVLTGDVVDQSIFAELLPTLLRVVEHDHRVQKSCRAESQCLQE